MTQTATYDGKTFEIENQSAYEAAIASFCRYHGYQQSDLMDWNYRYILEHVYPYFQSNPKKAQWPSPEFVAWSKKNNNRF